MTITYADTQRLVLDHHVRPHRCNRCRITAAQGASWQPFCDTQDDPQDVGFQCNACGNIQGMSRANILRHARATQR